jgi:hypothetical protein
MLRIQPIDEPFSLHELAARVRGTSNFRFAWQFFAVPDAVPDSSEQLRQVIGQVVEDPSCHAFLRHSFVAMYDDTFTIAPLHEHCDFAPRRAQFDDTLARAASDLLGAYGRLWHSASATDLQYVQETFGRPGEYRAFELLPGSVPDCPICRQYNHQLFTSWFYGVAWDWCYLVTWPARRIVWIGCLTDTD